MYEQEAKCEMCSKPVSHADLFYLRNVCNKCRVHVKHIAEGHESQDRPALLLYIHAQLHFLAKEDLRGKLPARIGSLNLGENYLENLSVLSLNFWAQTLKMASCVDFVSTPNITLSYRNGRP